MTTFQIKNSTSARGDVSIVCYDETSKIKAQREIKNLIVQVGKDYIAARLKDNTEAAISHMSLGNNLPSTAPALSQTTLVGEYSPKTALSTSTLGTDPATITFVATFGPGNSTGNVGEAGLFNADDIMLARTTFTTIPKGSGDTITITWTVTIG